MRYIDTVLIAANTARTNAYAQAMANSNISVKAAILFDDRTDKPGKIDKTPKSTWSDSSVFVPDLSIPVKESLSHVCEQLIEVSSNDVNSIDVLDAFKECYPRLAIYSGYGSQIVGKELLDACPNIIHLHAGWLPDYRGSTTIYYQLLNEGRCGVSAILLKESIDTGPILSRKFYPKPPAEVDIDYLYDGAIRADLLVNVLGHCIKYGKLPSIENQNLEDGIDYYIIHPTLKHISILSINSGMKLK